MSSSSWRERTTPCANIAWSSVTRTVILPSPRMSSRFSREGITGLSGERDPGPGCLCQGAAALGTDAEQVLHGRDAVEGGDQGADDSDVARARDLPFDEHDVVVDADVDVVVGGREPAPPQQPLHRALEREVAASEETQQLGAGQDPDKDRSAQHGDVTQVRFEHPSPNLCGIV